MIKPLLALPHVEYIGEISEAEKTEFLGNAHALLFPIDWPEPFGLVMIEAMACGTPVIAFNRGSVPEVIENGVSGFVVEDELRRDRRREAARHAVAREGPRRAFEARFSSKVDGATSTSALYEELLRQKRRTGCCAKSAHRLDRQVLPPRAESLKTTPRASRRAGRCRMYTFQVCLSGASRARAVETSDDIP